MIKPCIALHKSLDGVLTTLYIGEDADKAKKAYRGCTEPGSVAIFIRPAAELTKKNNADSVPVFVIADTDFALPEDPEVSDETEAEDAPKTKGRKGK
jgi:hypothetical protein